MTQYSLGTVGFEIQNTGGPQATAEINQLANAATTKLSPAAQKVIEDFQRTQAVMKRVEQGTRELTLATARLSDVQLRKATEGVQNYEQALVHSRQGMGNFGVVTQQAGYQVGDFLVQVQSGTNWMVALGQQATQLVGVLPMMTGLFGLSTTALIGLSAGLGIAIPLITAIGAYFIRSGEASEQAAKSVDKQAQAYQNLIEKVEELRLARQMEATGVQTSDEQIALNEINNLLREREALQNQILLATSQEMLVASQGRSALMATFLSDENERKQARIDEINAILKKLEYERELDIAARRRANELRNDYREQLASQREANRLIAEMLFNMVQASKVNISDVFSKAKGPLSSLLQGATDLYEKMAALAWLEQNKPGGKSYLANQYAMYGAGKAMSRQTIAESDSLYQAFPVPEEVRGGSSKREDRLRKEISLVKELTQAEKDRQSILQSIEGSLEEGFMSMVEGTKSVKDAFKTMAYEIIKELYRVLVVQRMVGAFTGGIGMLAGPSTGSFGLPFGRASGGSIMPNQPYLVGEHGPELVIPRHSGTVVNANQTSGAMAGGGAVTVQNNITVTGSDAAMVRAEVAKMIPQITNATKAAVIDAKQRGGQMAAAFR